MVCFLHAWIELYSFWSGTNVAFHSVMGWYLRLWSIPLGCFGGCSSGSSAVTQSFVDWLLSNRVHQIIYNTSSGIFMSHVLVDSKTQRVKVEQFTSMTTLLHLSYFAFCAIKAFLSLRSRPFVKACTLKVVVDGVLTWFGNTQSQMSQKWLKDKREITGTKKKGCSL